MRTLFCPHCYHAIEVEEVPPKVVCPACGLSFQIEQEPVSTGSDRPGVTANKLDRFDVLEKLGHGGQGTVYKAWDPTLKRVVALKVPKQELLSGKEEGERFLREAHSVSQLRHPGIVPVFEVCRDGDTPVLVSEFVQGISLDTVLETIARSGMNPGAPGLARWRNPRQAAELIAQCADAVHYAHEHGVVHRDLKPGNIMLQGSSPDSWLLTPDSCPKIMDFGLAKKDVGATTMTLDGQVLGTPAYMAPEQARGESHQVDRRADVYSLGVILYELLTGERPFRGNREMLLYQVLNAEPPNPRSLNHLIPRDLETCCLKCLQKEPKKRYQTAKEFADDLRRFLGGEAIQARPVGRVEKAWRWCKRNRAAAGLIAVMFILIVGGGLASVWYVQEQASRNRRAIADDLNAALHEARVLCERAWSTRSETTLAAAGEQLERAKSLWSTFENPSRSKSLELLELEFHSVRSSLIADQQRRDEERARRHLDSAAQVQAKNDRYNAACAAALAGTDHGKDDPPPDEEAKTRWRKQALEWLRADLAAWSKQLADKPDARPTVQNTLRHWQTDKDLSGVRDEKELAKLPAEEQETWKQLWAEVEALVDKTKPSK